MVVRGVMPYPMPFDQICRDLKRFQRWASRAFIEPSPSIPTASRKRGFVGVLEITAISLHRPPVRCRGCHEQFVSAAAHRCRSGPPGGGRWLNDGSRDRQGPRSLSQRQRRDMGRTRILALPLPHFGCAAKCGRKPIRYEITEKGRIAIALFRILANRTRRPQIHGEKAASHHAMLSSRSSITPCGRRHLRISPPLARSALSRRSAGRCLPPLPGALLTRTLHQSAFDNWTRWLRSIKRSLSMNWPPNPASPKSYHKLRRLRRSRKSNRHRPNVTQWPNASNEPTNAGFPSPTATTSCTETT